MIKRVSFSRRQAIKTVGLLGAAGAITSVRPKSAFAGLPKVHATALCIAGDRYHNPDYIRISLNKTLVRDNGLSIDYLWEDDYFTEDLLRNYKMLIIFRDGILHPEGYVFAYPEDLPAPGRNMENSILSGRPSVNALSAQNAVTGSLS